MSETNLAPSGFADTDAGNDFLQEFDPQKVLRTFRQSLWVIVLILLLAGTGAFLYLRFATPIYRANSTLKLELTGLASVLEIGVFESQEKIKNYMLGEMEFIRSPFIREKLIEKLDLKVGYYLRGKTWFRYHEKFDNSPFLLTNYEIKAPLIYDKEINVELTGERDFILKYSYGEEQVYEQTLRFGEAFSTPHFSGTLNRTSSFSIERSLGSYFFKVFSPPALNSYIAKNLEAYPINYQAYTIGTAFKDPNNYKAAIIVNALNEVYLEQTVENQNRVNRQTLTYLEKLLDTTEDSLQHFERAINDHRRNSGENNADLKDFQERLREVFANINALSEERFKLEVQIDAYKQIVEFLPEDSSFVKTSTYAMLLADGRVLEGLRELKAIEEERDRLFMSYKEPTTVHKNMQRKVQKKHSEILEIIQINLTLLHDQIRELNKEIESERQRIPSRGTADLELKRLQRYLGTYSQSFNEILNKIVETNISVAGTTPNFRVIAKAVPPNDAISPVKQQIYLLALGAGAALSLLIVAIRYLQQNQITELKEIERLTRVPVLGVVPFEGKQRKTKERFYFLAILKNPKSGLSEAIRSIRTNLEFISSFSEKRVISVTSTTSGEGKTFMALNLAAVIGLSELKVVLLDLDLRKPKVHLAFEVDNSKGISSLLIKRNSLEECIRHSEIGNLDFITAGPPPPNPSELLMSEAFDEFLVQLKEKYDVIVLDTPPVGLVTDGVVVMRKVDIPIYIVRADYTKRAFAQVVNRLAANKHFNKLSIVLNGVGKRNSYGAYGGYGYYYGDRHYGYYQNERPVGFLGRLRQRIKQRFNPE